MPAPNADGGVEQGTVVESLGLEEAELGSLSLGEEQLSSTELETLVSIEDELERLNAGVGAGSDSLVAHEVTVIAEEENVSILPDMQDDSELSEEVLTSIPEESFSIADEAMTVEQEIGETASEMVVETTPVSSTSPVSSTTVTATIPVLTGMPLTTSTGNIRLKSYSGPSSTMLPKPVAITSLRHIKPINSIPKKPITVNSSATSTNKMILSKVVLGTAQSGGMIQVSAGDTITGPQTIRVINAGNKKIISSPTKAITLAQARQMGLLAPGKLQQILPNTVSKKLVVSPKNTVTVVKQPTRILPAPAPASSSGQLQSIAPPVSTNSQKVLIRQGGTIKSGTIVSGNAQGQVIRIPAPQGLTAGNLHQIQLPGKQVQYVRLVNSNATSVASTNSTAVSGTMTSVVTSGKTLLPVTSITKPVPVALTTTTHTSYKMNTQRVLIPAPSAIAQLKAEANTAAVVQGTALNNFVMVPATYIQQQTSAAAVATTAKTPRSQSPAVSTASKAAIKLNKPVTTATPTPTTTIVAAAAAVNMAAEAVAVNTATAATASANAVVMEPQTITAISSHKSRSGVQALEPNGIRPRKPCNCTKSQCLKLYCDCFANGEFCHQCNCNCCYNNLEHEEDRQRAIKSCLERNPNAFRPKIGKSYVGDGERRHNKGCNCKRSGCLKNYCECYEAKIPCSNNCKCVGCQNIEDAKSLRELALAAEERVYQQAVVKNKLSAEIQGLASKPEQNQGPRQPFTLMTQEVVEATCQCLLAQAEDSVPVEEAERLILEEFGRCLVQIIDCASKTAASQPAAT